MNKTLIVFAAIMACAAAQPQLKSGALLKLVATSPLLAGFR